MFKLWPVHRTRHMKSEQRQCSMPQYIEAANKSCQMQLLAFRLSQTFDIQFWNNCRQFEEAYSSMTQSILKHLFNSDGRPVSWQLTLTFNLMKLDLKSSLHMSLPKLRCVDRRTGCKSKKRNVKIRSKITSTLWHVNWLEKHVN